MSCELAEGVAVVLGAGVVQDIFGYAYASDAEISCLGSVRRDGRALLVERVHLLAQTGSAGHTELDPSSVCDLMGELCATGRSEEARSLKCWIHSHPNGLGVFWIGRGIYKLVRG